MLQSEPPWTSLHIQNEKLTITLPQFKGKNILQTSFVHGYETEPVAGLKLRHDRLSKDY